MQKRQYKITNNLGNDTHTRPATNNIWQKQSSHTSETVLGEVFLPQPEPLFRQNMVSVKLARGGVVKNVAYPGAFIDPLTGNFHGLYEGPIPGQMVALAFANGNSASPYVVNRYPYQGSGNSFSELSYVLPLSKKFHHATDVVLGHFSGSFLSFNTGILPSIEIPGSVRMNAMTNMNIACNLAMVLDALVSAELKSAIVNVTGDVSATVSAPAVSVSGDVTATMSAPLAKVSSPLGGEVSMNALVQIKNPVFSMRALIYSLIDTVSGITVLGAPIDAPQIALLQAEKLKWALLLSA